MSGAVPVRDIRRQMFSKYTNWHMYVCDSLCSLLPSVLQPVGQALIYTLGQGLKEHFTDEVKSAWVVLYTIVQHNMELGMKEGLNI